jgi:16S rRNA (uracil1498-N3)-methyltransferase
VSEPRSQFRFFLEPGRLSNAVVRFPRDVSHQIAHVLRLQPGQEVIVLDGSGQEYVVELEMTGAEASGHVVKSRPTTAEPKTHVQLFPAVLKARKLELVLQKCTEIGAGSFRPLVCERSVAEEPGRDRVRRFDDIVREAAEQSGRGRIPRVEEAIQFQDGIETAPAGSLIFSNRDSESGARPQPLEAVIRGGSAETVSIFTGPEGGFTDNEIGMALAQGHKLVSLGPRTLRAETAAIVATALVLHHLEPAE